MTYTEHKITLDIHRTVSSVSLRVKKGDTGRRLLIHLVENGMPYHIDDGCYAVFTALKPDGKVVFNDCSIDKCVITYDFTAQTVAAAGLVDCEIILYGDDGKQLTSASFTIVVEDTIYDTETEVESTNEYNALAALISQVQAANTIGAMAPSIRCEECGERIYVSDASDYPLQGLRIFGKSTQDSTPTLDNPVEIVNMGAADGEIMLYIAGKNLFANSEMHAVDANGAEVNNGAARRTPYIPVRPGQKLAFSKSEALPADAEPNGMLRMYDKNRQFVSSVGALGYAGRTKVVTVPEGIYFVRFVQYGFTYVEGLEVQMEFAAAVTDYDGTAGQTMAISILNGLPGIPVSSGGNYTDNDGQQWICDEVDLGRGVYVRRIYTEVVTAEKIIRVDNEFASTGGAVAYFTLANKHSSNDNIRLVMCDKMPGISYNARGNPVDVYRCYAPGSDISVVCFRYPVSDGEKTIEEARLDFVGATVSYVLATPIETDLPEEELIAYAALHTNKPNTTIYNDAGAYMAAEYVADTKTYIDRRPGGASGSAASIGEVTLLAAGWIGNNSPYSQVVEIDGVTEYSQVDLTPSVQQLSVFHYKDLAFVTENDGGVVTVYAIGQKPENDYTIQVTITEVNV